MSRYDCRGHLYKLEEFDFPARPALSTEEMDIENILNEERYMDLKKDMDKEEIFQGWDIKSMF